ncbi:hypothetical protein [Kitasatospora sp. MAP5-34]|uniref:hypothetical protein n=1 Tax=Kitasatospora sp. MAP5-34 TaxID=3035102 RepID=UPI002472F843|nr:hypothetical protein [Kitasatospora sp. MAP5-34]MDH6576956.1 hypothetical protein [Kitasatospora sp. MAP5-34]
MTIRGTVRTVLATTACTGVLVGGLAACGTVTQLTTAQKVSGAFGKLGDAKTFKAEVSFDATADQIVAFEKSAGGTVDAKSAATIAELSLAVSVSSDKPLKDVAPKTPQASGDLDAFAGVKDVNLSYVLAGKSGTTYADVRLIAGKPYLKFDAAGIAKLAGKDPAELNTVAGQLPPELKVVKDALAGKWLSIDPTLLQQLAKDPKLGALAGAAGSASPSAAPSIDPKVAKDLTASLKDVLSHNLTFDDQGTKDGVDHIVASAPARGLAQGFLNAVKPFAKSIPNGDKLPGSVPTTVPDKKINVDLYLKGGALSSVSFDLAQLAEKAGPDVHLPIKLAFGQDVAPLEAPTGATEFGMSDITSMMGMFAKGAGGGLGAGLGAGPGAGGITPGKPATPLTDAQIKELTKAGIPEAQLKIMNQGGMSYDQIKALLTGAGAQN